MVTHQLRDTPGAICPGLVWEGMAQGTYVDLAIVGEGGDMSPSHPGPSIAQVFSGLWSRLCIHKVPTTATTLLVLSCHQHQGKPATPMGVPSPLVPASSPPVIPGSAPV